MANVRHPDLMIGIPLYSDLSTEHDYVVQAKGAYEDTIRGILNLKTCGVRVELRFVIHAETFARLPEFATFVTRNLLFVDHVALMGLELMGFARANLDSLWIDPLDYGEALATATHTLARAGLRVSIYNHQLCVLPPDLHPFARKSISDWKNEYVADCAACDQRDGCGGFFASSQLRRSRGITPLRQAPGTTGLI
jgi:His-Xaa-Ser system radical SAM maturase HxsC